MDHWHWSVVFSHWEWFLAGGIMTVKLVVITMLTSLVTGLIVALCAYSRNRIIKGLAIAYIEILRDIPLLLELFFVFEVTPLSPFIAGYIGLTLNLTAFLAEVYRSGLTSIDAGQSEAGLTLGMTNRQVLRRIIIPQSVVRVIPPIGTFWVSLFRDSALVSIIGIHELTYQAQHLASITYRPLVVFTALAIIYMVLTYPQARLVSWIHERLRVRE